MQSLSYTFKGYGDKIYNDVPYPPPPFDLLNKSYSFIIKPKTKFWRFGIRFSKTQEAEFFTETGRYENKELKHIEVAVGERPESGKWIFPNNLYLQQYYFFNRDEGGVLTHWVSYPSRAEVRLTVQHDLNAQSIIVSCSAEKCELYSTEISISDYHFFRISAWADKIDFELDCEIDITELMVTKEVASSQESSIDIGNADGVLLLEGATNFQFRNDGVKAALNVKHQAEIFFKLLKNFKEKETGLLLGIFGRWGRGKTFFWRKLTENFKNTDEIEFEHLEFHAWKYQDTPASWAYLYELFVKKFYSKQGKILPAFLSILTNRLRLNLARLGKLKFLYGVGVLIFGFIWYFLFDLAFKWDLFWNVITSGFLGIIVSSVLFYFYSSNTAKDLIRNYFSETSFKDLLGIQAEIQKEFITLLKCWIPEEVKGKKRIVLFVDDIDRCNEGRIIEVIDSLKIMMDDAFVSERVIVIAAIDETVLKRAIKQKYFKMVYRDPQLQQEEKRLALEQLCREYMDKLFINGFKLGSLSTDDKIEVFKTLTEDQTFFRNDQKKEEKYRLKNVSLSGSSRSSEIQIQMRKVKGAGNFAAVVPNKDFEIMDYEVQYLSKAIERFKNATPRLIRIFYYRYLLAKYFKTLLILEDSEIYNEWNVDQDRKALLPYLIVEYSSIKMEKELLTEIERIIALDDAKVMVDCLGTSFNLSRHLYLSLLKVVEIVVPY